MWPLALRNVRCQRWRYEQRRSLGGCQEYSQKAHGHGGQSHARNSLDHSRDCEHNGDKHCLQNIHASIVEGATKTVHHERQRGILREIRRKRPRTIRRKCGMIYLRKALDYRIECRQRRGRCLRSRRAGHCRYQTIAVGGRLRDRACQIAGDQPTCAPTVIRPASRCSDPAPPTDRPPSNQRAHSTSFVCCRPLYRLAPNSDLPATLVSGRGRWRR